MATVAVLGMGLLGRGFAEHMVELGHTVRVWNRTAARCAPVVEQGAVQALTPEAAVEGADLVHLVLKSDDAVESVIEQLRPGLGEGVPVIDHSTNLPARVEIRAAALAAEGVRYLHAPVFMGPRNSREGTGLMLFSGPQAAFEALLPHLSTLTGKVSYYGETANKAAAVKIIGNSVLIMLTATMGDAFKLGAGTGVSPDEILALFESFAPSPAGMGKRILASADSPVGFEASMARKDVGLMLDSGAAYDLLPAVAAALDAAIAGGRGAEDFTAVFRPE